MFSLLISLTELYLTFYSFNTRFTSNKMKYSKNNAGYISVLRFLFSSTDPLFLIILFSFTIRHQASENADIIKEKVEIASNLLSQRKSMQRNVRHLKQCSFKNGELLLWWLFLQVPLRYYFLLLFLFAMFLWLFLHSEIEFH